MGRYRRGDVVDPGEAPDLLAVPEYRERVLFFYKQSLDEVREDVGYALLLLGLLHRRDDVERTPDRVVEAVLGLVGPAQPLPDELAEAVVGVRDALLVGVLLAARDRLGALVDHGGGDVDDLADLLFLGVPQDVLVQHEVAVEDVGRVLVEALDAEDARGGLDHDVLVPHDLPHEALVGEVALDEVVVALALRPAVAEEVVDAGDLVARLDELRDHPLHQRPLGACYEYLHLPSISL